MSERGVKLGLVGLGTIGSGVVRVMQAHGSIIDTRLGFPLRLERIAELDLDLDRGLELAGYTLTRRWQDLIDEPEIDIVLELIGGTTVARSVVVAAMEAGKSVVTANKALLAHHGPELYEIAARHGVDIAFEASVGGTIPILRALREGLCADRAEVVLGIVNGTCNYVLTEMEGEEEPYEACLKRAQELGYAEADPSFDVNGTDSAHKLALLIGLAMGVRVRPDQIPTEGIERVSPLDIEYARRFGLRIKLLAIAKLWEGAVEARVFPTMIPENSVLARVDGSMNAVQVSGTLSGPTLYYGAGAGSLPTASAVVSDAMELARSKRLGIAGRVPPLGTPQLRALPLRPTEDLVGEYYLRFSAVNRPGVLARITGELGDHGISIASVVQREQAGSEVVPVVIMTHAAKEAGLVAALRAIEGMGEVTGRVQLIRVEREI